MKYAGALILLLGSSLAIVRAQALPDGEGKNLVQNVCGSCHDTDIVASQRHTKEEWQGVVEGMVQSGGSVSSDDIKIIVAYLAKSFPPESK